MSSSPSDLPNNLSRQTRRAFLSTMGNGIGSIALANMLADDGLLASETQSQTGKSHFPAKAKSCIFITLTGGTSQVDLFDPKPKLNELAGQGLPASLLDKSRFASLTPESATIVPSPRKFAKYGNCGMDFSELLPHTATCADDICMIRSMQTDAFNHHLGELFLHTGVQEFGRPSVGAWINYGIGSESDNLPGYAVMNAGATSFGGASLWSSGFLPTNKQGVVFRTRGEPIANIQTPHIVSRELQQLTRGGIKRLNQIHYDESPAQDIDNAIDNYELAFRMQNSVPELTSFRDESQRTLEQYGLNRKPTRELEVWEHTGSSYHDFSRNCLMARRLVERDVRFVHLIFGGWDHHYGLDGRLAYGCGAIDQPIAALLKDLKQRGLLESTLVVCATEFGRTPLGDNKDGNPAVTGRDHQPQAFSIWLAGAGVKTGQTVGTTDEIGWNVTEDPIHIHDLQATILHLFGLDHERLTFQFGGRDIRLTDVGGRVIPNLLS